MFLKRLKKNNIKIAVASNKLELFGLSNGRLQFDIFGNNAVAASIDITISNNDTTSLVTQINSKTLETGITASVSGNGAILLNQSEGNDIALKDFSIASGNVSARQIDKFGEKIQSSPITIVTGKHAISGGQVEIRSPSSFTLAFNGATQTSTASSFEDGFVKKTNNLSTNATEYSFKASSLIDGNLLDDAQSTAVASSSSYGLTLSSDNTNQTIAAVFKPRSVDAFSSKEISKNIVS